MGLNSTKTWFYQLILDKYDSNDTNIIQYFIINVGIGPNSWIFGVSPKSVETYSYLIV